MEDKTLRWCHSSTHVLWCKFRFDIRFYKSDIMFYYLGRLEEGVPYLICNIYNRVAYKLNSLLVVKCK